MYHILPYYKNMSLLELNLTTVMYAYTIDKIKILERIKKSTSKQKQTYT